MAPKQTSPQPPPDVEAENETPSFPAFSQVDLAQPRRLVEPSFRMARRASRSPRVVTWELLGQAWGTFFPPRAIWEFTTSFTGHPKLSA